jgi:nucleoid-associated protein YgaU
MTALGAVLLGATGLQVCWTAAAAPLDAVRSSGPGAPDDLLVLGAAGAGAVLLLWLTLGAVLAALAALPGLAGRLAAIGADRIAPAALRRTTAVLLGASMATAATPLAHAAGPLPTSTPTTSTGQTTSRTMTPPAFDVSFGSTVRPAAPDAVLDPRDSTTSAPRPATAPDPAFGVGAPPATPDLGPLAPKPHSPSTATTPRTVTVVQGDSLWAIAARHLGPNPTRQQIAREWPRWYAANRAVIGPNPNVIRVGQVLDVPGAAS